MRMLQRTMVSDTLSPPASGTSSPAKILILGLSLALAVLLPWRAFATTAETAARLVLIPPSPVTDQITLDIRAAAYWAGEGEAKFEIAIYLDAEQPDKLLLRRHIDVQAGGAGGVRLRCPFAFHRMPAGDLTGEEAAAVLQSLCDRSGCHLWMDLETFVFCNVWELHPRPIEGLVSDISRFPNFEKILHYEFPGMMSSPQMSRRPGGPASVRLYEDYRRYLRGVPETRVPGALQ